MEMIRNKSNIFSVDQGINRKKNRKQCAMRIDAVFIHHRILNQVLLPFPPYRLKHR